MAGAVGDGPRGVLQTVAVVGLYVLGLIAAGSLALVMARAFYSSAYLCVQPFPPRYGQMEAKRAAAERLKQKERKAAAAAEARRPRQARAGKELSPLPPPSSGGVPLSSVEEGKAGYDAINGRGQGEEGKAEAPPPTARCSGPKSGFDGSRSMPAPPCRRGWGLHTTAAAHDPRHVEPAALSMVRPLPTLLLPPMMPPSRPYRQHSASFSSSSSSSSEPSPSNGQEGATSTRPRARAGVGGDVDSDGGLCRGNVWMMAVP